MRKNRFFLPFFVVGFLVSRACALDTFINNYLGYMDTCKWYDTLSESEVWYSKAWVLTDYEDMRTLLKVSADTCFVRWGYQTGTLTLNSSGIRDTLWNFRVVLDTLTTDSLGKEAEARVDSNGVLYRGTKMLDSADVAGYNVQSVWFVPEWDEFIRYFIIGMTGNPARRITYIIEPHRRFGVRTYPK